MGEMQKKKKKKRIVGPKRALKSEPTLFKWGAEWTRMRGREREKKVRRPSVGEVTASHIIHRLVLLISVIQWKSMYSRYVCLYV